MLTCTRGQVDAKEAPEVGARVGLGKQALNVVLEREVEGLRWKVPVAPKQMSKQGLEIYRMDAYLPSCTAWRSHSW